VSNFGFDKVNKPANEERKLDLSGIHMTAPVPPVEKEKKAVAKGEQLGFSSREPDRPTRGQGRVERKRQQTPMRSIYIKGPESVLDRFIAYTNQLGVDAYWQALEKLLNEKQ
jgi:hypothetical protein